MQAHPTTPTPSGTLDALVSILSDANYDWRAGYRAALVEVGLLLIAESDRLDGAQRPPIEEATPAATASGAPTSSAVYPPSLGG